MEKIFYIIQLKKIVKKIINNKKITAYIFGSILKKNDFKDIDLLLVYDNRAVSISDILLCKKEIIKEFSSLYFITIDIVMLSSEENMEINFNIAEKAIKIE